MDCSGLLLRSFEAIDYPMPRTTTDQIRLGKKVGMTSVQKGDLVFFKAEKGRNKVRHVGMVTAVVDANDIRFIHSSTKLGVVESNLLSNYYKKIFLQARRIL
jgi:cell wall-associated NlpC family hydrolase